VWTDSATYACRLAVTGRRLPQGCPVAPWLLCLLGLIAIPAQAENSTAAMLDWVPWDDLSASEQEQIPAYCGGAYRAPERVELLGEEDGSVHISSREARYRADESLTLSGDVQIRRGPFQASGDRAEYSQQTGEASLEGSVQSRGDGFLITGDDARFRTDTGEIDLNTASFLLHEGHMRGEATSLQRTGPSSLRINSGAMTTCQPGNRDWSLAAGRVDLDQESGFGTARHVRLQVRDVPVFYVPWMTFPIDDRRKSGFLYPSFGTSNTGSGLFLATPYYFNLAPHYDATFTPQYIHGRGLFSELEARHLSPLGPSELGLGYIDNDSDFASEFPDENSRRWGFSFSNQSRLSPEWSSELDYNVVSDDDYLSDLNQTLDLQQTTHLPRTARVRYQRPDLQFTGSLRGFQTLDSEIAESDRPYNQLPALNLSTQQQAGPADVLGNAEYVYFWRDNDGLTGRDSAIGSRLRAQPEVALQWRGLPGFVRTSVMVDHSEYVLEDVAEDRFTRTVPFADLDAGLYFDRDLTLFGQDYSQTLEPRLYYVYSPFREQDDIPLFDTSVTSFNFDQLFARDRFTGGDRIGDNNRLSTAVTTRFNDRWQGMERARFSIGQIFRFDDEEVSAADGAGLSDGRESPLAAEIFARPLNNLSLMVSGLWDVDEEKTLRGRSQARFHSQDFRYLMSIGHTYDAQDVLEQSDIGVVFPLGQQTSLIGRWVYDMALEETAGSLAGLEYTTCCWSMQLVAQSYRTRDDGLDHRIIFQIRLRGLGAGGSAGDVVAEAIPGFEQREPWQHRHSQGRL